MNQHADTNLLLDLLTWLGETDLSFYLGATIWFPILESLHVLVIVVLLAILLRLDLYLLNPGDNAVRQAKEQLIGRSSDITSNQASDQTNVVQDALSEIKALTTPIWIAFAAAAGTGLGLFISRPVHYADNPAFQIKLALLIACGINVAVLHRYVLAGWKPQEALPAHTHTAAIVSILLWISVVLAGRWVGHLN